MPAQPLHTDTFTPFKRPRRTGEPLTAGSNRTLPKPGRLITCMPAPNHRPLELADRRLFNLLLACSWSKLTRGDLTPLAIAAAPARRALGQVRRHDNVRLQQALERLCTRAVMIEGLGSMPLLRDADVMGRELAWAFPDALAPLLIDPMPWGRIDLDRCSRMPSVAALVLYENFALRANLKRPVWRVNVTDLSRLLSRRGLDWSGLRRLLNPACSAVAALGGLDSRYETEVAPKTGRVETLIFSIRRTGTTDTNSTE